MTASTVQNVARTATPAATLLADPVLGPLLAPVNDTVEAALAYAAVIGNQPVGSVTADITTATTARPSTSGVCGDPALTRDDRASESTLGNLVANSLLSTLSDEQLGGAEIGVVNPGGLRAELCYAADPKNPADSTGTILYAEANGVLPFVNNLWTIDLTGAQFKTALEQQWQRNADGTVPSRPYLQLGLSDNVTYTYDPTRARGLPHHLGDGERRAAGSGPDVPGRQLLVPARGRRQLPRVRQRHEQEGLRSDRPGRLDRLPDGQCAGVAGLRPALRGRDRAADDGGRRGHRRVRRGQARSDQQGLPGEHDAGRCALAGRPGVGSCRHPARLVRGRRPAPHTSSSRFRPRSRPAPGTWCSRPRRPTPPSPSR